LAWLDAAAQASTHQTGVSRYPYRRQLLSASSLIRHDRRMSRVIFILLGVIVAIIALRLLAALVYAA
jgi:hypothetical protein